MVSVMVITDQSKWWTLLGTNTFSYMQAYIYKNIAYLYFKMEDTDTVCGKLLAKHHCI